MRHSPTPSTFAQVAKIVRIPQYEPVRPIGDHCRFYKIVQDCRRKVPALLLISNRQFGSILDVISAVMNGTWLSALLCCM
jgi:hypothetical protein